MPDVVGDEGCNEVVAMIITLEDKIRHCSVPFRNPDINVSLPNESFKLSCHLICLYMLQKATESEACHLMFTFGLYMHKHTWAHVPPWKEEKISLTHVLSLFEKKGINSSNSTSNGASWIYSNENHCYRGRKCNLLSSKYEVSSFERKTLRLENF